MFREKDGFKNERGAVVVEATIALAAFIFAIFTILSVVNMCFIQAKIGASLANSAKEVSQCSFLYYKFGLNNQQPAHDSTAQARVTVDQTIEGVGAMFGSFDDLKSSAGIGGAGSFDVSDFDIGGLSDAIKTGGDAGKDLVNLYAEQLSDPRKFFVGMLKLAGDEAINEAKDWLGQILTKVFLEKHLVETPADSPDRFLRRYHVVDGLDGLNFSGSSLMAYGQSNEIQMVVTYKIQVVKLLGFDVRYTIKQCAKTEAWGNGVSLITEKKAEENEINIWDSFNNDMARNKKITELEMAKAHYIYSLSDGRKYGAFDANNNTLIMYTSYYSKDGNETAKNVQTKLEDRLKSLQEEARPAKNQMDKTGSITVKDASGKKAEVKSDPSTRSYKLVIVIPENANVALYTEQAAIFEAANPGVMVEVNTNYGKGKKYE